MSFHSRLPLLILVPLALAFGVPAASACMGGGGHPAPPHKQPPSRFQPPHNPLPLPTVTTDPATAITTTGATLNASIDANGDETHVYFQYGTSLAYGSTSPAAPGADFGSGLTAAPFAVAITGLTADTTYDFRVVGVDGAGAVDGANQSFTTATVISTPSATVDSASEDAALNGKADVSGTRAATQPPRSYQHI